MNESTNRVVPVQVGRATIQIEARSLGGGSKVSVLDALPFGDITAALDAMGQELSAAMARIGPRKATVEMGLEVGIEAGKLVALIAQGSAKANLKVTLEWSPESPART